MQKRIQIAVGIFILISIFSYGLGRFGGLFHRAVTVPELTVVELQALQPKRNASQLPDPEFVLVDVRTPEEYGVSIIPEAITKESFERNYEAYRDHTVVAYCTIGYRSGKYAEKLIADGFTAKNFKGSILAWCQAGLPLVTIKGKNTNRVHTYSSKYKVPATYTAVY